MAEFFDAIGRSAELPSVIRLRYLDGGDDYAALFRALNARHAKTLMLANRERPFASKEFGRKGSGSTRKKLRQSWNRLASIGKAEVTNERTPAAVQAAFEIYLAMEAKSWKGTQGTALLSNARDAAFARQLIGGLAKRNEASVALLLCDGEAIATQVLLYCGSTAYTWKTAFNSDYAKYSPGALLVDKITDDLFSTPAIAAIKSCSPEGGFMTQLWEGRRSTIDLLVDVGPKESLDFILAAIGERGYAQLRVLRNRIRSFTWATYPRRKSLAGS